LPPTLTPPTSTPMAFLLHPIIRDSPENTDYINKSQMGDSHLFRHKDLSRLQKSKRIKVTVTHLACSCIFRGDKAKLPIERMLLSIIKWIMASAPICIFSFGIT
jgi:hypothetical protein